MINGIHVLFYSNDPEADRAFFRDVLQFPTIDIGRGWLLFGLPPAEAAVHPANGNPEQVHAGHHHLGAVVYLMCDDVRATIATLATRGVTCTDVSEEAWGIRTTVRMPSGSEIGLYQPTHPTALKLGPSTGSA
jgi:catechol 2,3-dioxygenase-like lactoylglutathione lyase family enzyme